MEPAGKLSGSRAAEVRALSTTASIPARLPSAALVTGTPPPPPHTTRAPASASAVTASQCRYGLMADLVMASGIV